MSIRYSYLKWKAFLLEGRRPSTREITERLALSHREKLYKTKFIGITGSGGKTTTARLLHHFLSEENSCMLSAFENTIKSIPKRICQTNIDNDFAVFEISGHEPGAINASCAFVKPNVGIVTIVASDHYTTFRGDENTAKEKVCLVENVSEGGMVFLNADDPHVIAMRNRSKSKNITYGTVNVADYKATELEVTEQGRLQFKCKHDDRVVPFDIGLLGAHFITPVLAAISCANQLGRPLMALAERAKTFTQTPGRCSIHTSENGPVFICDTTKAPFQTVHLALDLVKHFPHAPRKTIVLGTISDRSGSVSRRYTTTYETARHLADRIVFFGKAAAHAKPNQADLREGRVLFVDDIVGLRDLIKSTRIINELIILKGSGAVDHLERIAISFESTVKCWDVNCRLVTPCFGCDKLSN
jgi:UDP-N-acetylmuramoyl-tripeptide--D-alanyl-D-alanine ligase